MVTSLLTRPESSPVPRSLMHRCEGTGLQGDGAPICYAAYCSSAKTRSHIHLGNGTFFLSSLRAFLFALENRAFRYDTGLEIAPKRNQ
jgi:hypothetical protein